MRIQKRKKSIFSIMMAFAMMILMVFPTVAFADEGNTPVTEETTDAAGEESSAEEAPGAGDAADQSTSDESDEGDAVDQSTSDELNAEETKDAASDGTVVDETTAAEDIGGLVAALDEAGAVLVDEVGEAIPLACAEAEEALETINAESSDPYFPYNDGINPTVWIGYTHPGGTCHSIVTECHEIVNPIQATLDDSRSIGTYIRIDGLASDYKDDVFTLDDRPHYFSLRTGADVSVNTINLNTSLSNITYDPSYNYSLFANNIYVMGGGTTASIQDGVDMVADGGTVNVSAGEYVENVVIDKQLTLMGAGSGYDGLSASTVISGSDDVLTVTTGGTDATVRQVVQNIQVTNKNDTGNGIVLVDGTNTIAHLTLYNVASINNKNGILMGLGNGTFQNTKFEDIVFNSCVFSDNASIGINPGGADAIRGFDLIDCKANENGVAGFQSYQYSGGITGINISGGSYANNNTDNWDHSGIYIGGQLGNAGLNSHFLPGDLLPNTFENFDVSNTSRGLFAWIFGDSAISVNGLTGNNLGTAGGYGAISLLATNTAVDHIEITNCEFSNVNSDPVVGAILVEAYFTSKGIPFGNDAYASIDNLKINNCSVNNSTVGIALRAKESTKYPGSKIITNASVANNTLVGNNVGVSVIGVVANSTINNNMIFDNISHGVDALTATSTINATYNWWGASSGPTHTTNPTGTGDVVSDFVDFDPWLIDPDGDLVFESSDGTGGYVDNCPTTYNPDQLDSDGDGIGNSCDPTPYPPTPTAGGAGAGVGVALGPVPLIPVTGAGELVELSCDYANTLELPGGDSIIFDSILCGYFAELVTETEETLPAELPDGDDFVSGMTLNLLLDGELVDGETFTISFVIPEGIESSDFAVMAWDADTGSWVEVGDVTVADGFVTVTVDYPGTFVLVAR